LQDDAAFEATTGSANLASGDGWITSEFNPGSEQGKEATVKFDWAEDAEKNLPISPVTKEEPAAEVTKDMLDAWTAEHGLGGGTWGTDNTANGLDGWEDPPKVTEPTRDVSWDITTSDNKWGSKTHNDDWNTVTPKGKQSKSAAKKEKGKEKYFASPPKDKENGFHKGPAEKDRKVWGKGWKEEGLIGNRKGKKGGKSAPTPPPPPPPAKPCASTSTKFGPAKEKQAAGPKTAFTFNRIEPAPAATPLSTKKRWDEDGEPDPDSFPELPPGVKDKVPVELQNILRQAVVPKGKMLAQPSVAPLPENTLGDKGMHWVNGTLDTVDTPKVFSEHKAQTNDAKQSSGKASPNMGDWPELGG